MKFFSIILTSLLLSPVILSAQSEAKEESKSLVELDFSANKTIINSDKLTLFSNKREFTYSGAVDMLHGDLKLTCKELDGSYSEANEIENLVAKEDVYIEKGLNIKAYGNRATYSASEQTLTLTENPKLEQEGSILAADEVIIYLDEDRSEAVGNVRVTLLDKSKNNNNKQNETKTNKKEAKKESSVPSVEATNNQ